MEKLTKEDLKGPDAFQSTFEILSEFFFHHRLTIIASAAVLLLAGIIWAGVGIYSSNVEDRAQEALFQAEKKLEAADALFEKSKAPTAPKPTGELEVDYKESLPLLRSVISQFPKSQAAVLATLDLSKLYQDHKLYEPQFSMLEHAADNARHPVTKGLTLNQLALAYEGKGDCGKAIETWQKIESMKELSFLAGKSLINIGLCYEKLHQNAKAEQAYLKAEGLLKDGDTAKIAKKYLRLLKRDQAT